MQRDLEVLRWVSSGPGVKVGLNRTEGKLQRPAWYSVKAKGISVKGFKVRLVLAMSVKDLLNWSECRRKTHSECGQHHCTAQSLDRTKGKSQMRTSMCMSILCSLLLTLGDTTCSLRLLPLSFPVMMGWNCCFCPGTFCSNKIPQQGNEGHEVAATG